MARLTGSDDLFVLIKSLSKEEKGYFVKYAKRHSEKGSQLLTLFNLISKQDKYDEKALKLKVKHLPVIKNMLFEQILQSIYVANHTISIARQIERNTAFAGILFEKGMINRSVKLLEQSYDLAIQNDLLPRALVIHSLLEDVVTNSIPQKERWEKIHSFHKEETVLLEKLTAHSKLFFEERKAAFISRLEDEKEVKVKLKSVDLNALDDKKNLKTSTAKLVRLTTLMMYYRMSGNTKKHYELSKENLAFQLEQFNRNKSLVQQINLAIAYMNHSNTCLDTGQLKEAEKVLGELKKLDCPHKGIQLHKTFCEVHVQQELHFWENEFAKGAQYSVQALEQKQLAKHAVEQLFVYQTLLQNKILFYLLSNDLQKAYLTMQELRPLAKEAENPKLTADIWLMELIIQKAMGNNDIALQIYKLMEKWNKKAKFLSAELMQTTIALLKQEQPFIPQTGYLIFNKLSFIDWVKSITERKSLPSLVAAFNRQSLTQKRAFR